MNDALREHVTGAGFVLTLGKTHIQSMVELEWRMRASERGHDPRDPGSTIGPLNRFFVPAAGGLQSRGLVWHDLRYDGTRPKRRPLHKEWGFTKAGELVRDLLVEAGIWQEYAATLPALPRRKKAA